MKLQRIELLLFLFFKGRRHRVVSELFLVTMKRNFFPQARKKLLVKNED